MAKGLFMKPRELARSHFKIAYNGPDVEGGRMDVRDLAPALMALGDLVQDAAKLADPDSPPVNLEIQATNEGSFEVDLILIGANTPWGQLINSLTSDEVNALTNLQELIFGGGGLVFTIALLRGRRVKTTKPAESAGYLKVTLEDGETVEMDERVAAMTRSVTIRKATREVVRPLERSGVDSFAVRTDTTTVEILKEQVGAFEVPEIEPVEVIANEFEMAVMIEAAVFKEGNKWKFNDGGGTFYAAIEDKDFLAKIDAGQPFHKGDSLKCVVRQQQFQTTTGLKAEWSVVKVIEHIPRLDQLPLLGDLEDG